MEETSSPNSKRAKLLDELDEQSAATTLYWPEALIGLILLRLPIKSILRFKSTCKSWNSLIRSRSFVELHRCRNLHNNNRHDLTLDYSKEFPRFRYETYRYSRIEMLGSLNNGICCRISQIFTAGPKQQIEFCNLATGESNVITHPFTDINGVLSTDTKNYNYGFGVVPKDCNGVVDYKMVAIERSWSEIHSRASVYSQRRGTWKLIGDRSNIRLASINQEFDWLTAQAYLNGSCHWVAKLFDLNNPNPHCVLRFDMVNEVFDLIAAPPLNDTTFHQKKHTHDQKSGVFVLDDHLAVVIVVHRHIPFVRIEHIDVWMMMEYGVEKSWTNIFSSGDRLGGCFERFLGVSSSKSKDGITTIDRIFFHHGNMNLMSCDSSGFREHSTFDGWVKTVGISTYVETLEPVKLEDEG